MTTHLPADDHWIAQIVRRLKPMLRPHELVDVQVVADLEDDRQIVRTETWSDGRKFVAILRNEGPIFRGTFQNGVQYRRGDWIVFSGSTWACINDTSEPPGEKKLESWTIVARRGRDGKDFRTKESP